MLQDTNCDVTSENLNMSNAKLKNTFNMSKYNTMIKIEKKKLD